MTSNVKTIRRTNGPIAQLPQHGYSPLEKRTQGETARSQILFVFCIQKRWRTTIRRIALTRFAPYSLQKLQLRRKKATQRETARSQILFVFCIQKAPKGRPPDRRYCSCFASKKGGTNNCVCALPNRGRVLPDERRRLADERRTSAAKPTATLRQFHELEHPAPQLAACNPRT